MRQHKLLQKRIRLVETPLLIYVYSPLWLLHECFNQKNFGVLMLTVRNKGVTISLRVTITGDDHSLIEGD